jgi:hypothetical protein
MAEHNSLKGGEHNKKNKYFEVVSAKLHNDCAIPEGTVI